MKRCWFFTLAALALACASCGQSHGLYPVSGRVTYQGEPAAGAFVFFNRQGADPLQEQTIMGLVQEDGSFTLDCGGLGKGAPPGNYDVLIEWKNDARNLKGLYQLAGRRDQLGGRYADPKRPLLHAVVQAETNILPPFELTDTPPARKADSAPVRKKGQTR